MLEAAFAQSDYAFHLADAKGVLLRVNDAYLKLYKFSASEEVLGRTQQALCSPDTPEGVLRDMEKNLSAGNSWQGDLVHRAKDGSEVHVHLTLTPIEVDGKIVGHMGLTLDRIPYLHKEMQLCLARKQAIVGILGTGLAHELNNPLATLMLDADFIQETLSHPILPEARRLQALRATESILRGVETVSKVLNHFLDFSSEDPPDYAMTFALNDLLDDCLMLMEGSLHAGGIEIRLDTEEGLWVRGNRGQLESVLFHLLSNSRDAFNKSPVGSKLIFISTRPMETRDRILIEYSDNSGGISLDSLGKIFDPLYSLHGGENSGFGLAQCRKILREHGGDIDCEAGNGELRFKIRLPSASPESRAKVPLFRIGAKPEGLKIKVLRPLPPRISRRELGYTATKAARKRRGH